jgi:acyl-coenzyme A synthetase/AMP-(fatty) acid ligase
LKDFCDARQGGIELGKQRLFTYFINDPFIPKEWTGEETELIAELKKLARTKISGFAVPDRVLVTPGLPKTRSGKIMRRQADNKSFKGAQA